MEIDFCPITLAARNEIMRFTLSGSLWNCDFAFANMYSWQFLYRSEYAVVEETLFIRFFIEEGRPAYMMPQGAMPLGESMSLLQSDAARLGHALCLLGISEECRTRLNEVLPGRFRFVIERDYADYIYLRETLANLSGKHLQPKRNHINRFVKKYPDYRYLPLTPEFVPACLRFEEEWMKDTSPEYAEELAQEQQAMIRALSNFEALGLTGGTLWVGGRLVAFTYGSPITYDTFGVHVEKADAAFDGAYAMVNREFVRTLPDTYTYVNREEDLGIPGLRQAKLSYQPFRLQEKMAAFYLHNREISSEVVLSVQGAGESAPDGSLTLRQATAEERPAIEDLWQTCFHDDPRFVRLFFSRKFSPDHTYIAVRGRRLCAALQPLPYLISLWGREEPMAYWAGLSTYPAERGQGIMGALMAHTFSFLRQRGGALAALIPAETSLYDYYGRFGFETIFYRRKSLYVRAGKVSSPSGRFSASNRLSDVESLSQAWKELTAGIPCRVLQSADDMEVVCEDVRLSGGDVWTATDSDGSIASIAFVVPLQESLSVLDICAVDEEALGTLLSAFCSYYGAQRLCLSQPVEAVGPLPTFPGWSLESSEVTPRGMLRITDADLLLSRYAEAYPTTHCTLRLTDEQMPVNEGIYEIKEGCSCKQPLSSCPQESSCDYIFDIHALTRWLFTGESGAKPYLSLLFSE
ncbi:MAG: GNAT family N-acetyltransferase [Porphyromonadaceae bacterium]|nr:GNAT family N-acetyltransferase [Porphyromonadaceae bacterium]